MAREKKQNTFRVLETKLYKEDINSVQRDGSIELWHRRLRHINKKRIQILARKQFLPNLQGMSLTTCDHCFVGKEHRVSFYTNS